MTPINISMIVLIYWLIKLIIKGLISLGLSISFWMMSKKEKKLRNRTDSYYELNSSEPSFSGDSEVGLSSP